MAQAWSNVEWRKFVLFALPWAAPPRAARCRAEATPIPNHQAGILRTKAAGTAGNGRERVEFGEFAQRLVAMSAGVVVAVGKWLADVRVGGGFAVAVPP
jgi:hypothetical protein